MAQHFIAACILRAGVLAYAAHMLEALEKWRISGARRHVLHLRFSGTGHWLTHSLAQAPARDLGACFLQASALAH